MFVRHDAKLKASERSSSCTHLKFIEQMSKSKTAVVRMYLNTTIIVVIKNKLPMKNPTNIIEI